MSKPRNPLNDEDYDGNDDQISDLKELYHAAASLLEDIITMAENEILRIRTGKAPGPAMRDRDVLGQWQATVRDARSLLRQYKE